MSIAYRLAYFNLKGRGEIIRYIFKAAKVEYIDERFDFKQFTARKASGEFAANFDRVPVLFINDTDPIGQSKSIERYLSKKYNMMGDNEDQTLHIDMLTEHCHDIREMYKKTCAGKKGDDLVKAKQAFVVDELPGWMNKLDKSIKPSAGKPYVVGSKLSLADLYMFNMAYDYFDPCDEMNAILASCKNIQSSADVTKGVLKEYLSSRPVTKM